MITFGLMALSDHIRIDGLRRNPCGGPFGGQDPRAHRTARVLLFFCSCYMHASRSPTMKKTTMWGTTRKSTLTQVVKGMLHMLTGLAFFFFVVVLPCVFSSVVP